MVPATDVVGTVGMFSAGRSQQALLCSPLHDRSGPKGWVGRRPVPCRPAYHRCVDAESAARVIELFEGRGQLDRLEHADANAALACLARANERLRAASVLADAELWESAFTTAYDAYRTSADALVLSLGCRVPATQGGHRIATDVAHAALKSDSEAFSPGGAERFRQGRHESEYFDPGRPVDKTEADTRWAIKMATSAIGAVDAELSAL
jgi:hypothetical protein